MNARLSPKILLAVLGVALIAAIAIFGMRKSSAGPSFSLAKPLEDFALLDHRGDLFELYRGAKVGGHRAIVFISTGIGCPIVEKSLPKMQALAEKYENKKIHFVLVNSNIQDSRKEITQQANAFAVKIPILLDQSQVVADALHFDRTAEAVVVETENWQIVYRGAIDDRLNYSDAKAAAKNEYLGNALDDFLENKEIRLAKTETMGCAISRLSWPNPITYYDHVAPILQAKCLQCHRDGGSPPQNMGNFSEARGWAAMIREVLRTNRMPPDQPDPYIAPVLFSTTLTDEEKGILVKWVDTGGQEGKRRKLPPIKYSKLPPIRVDYTLGPVSVASPQPGHDPYTRSFLGVAPKDIWMTANEREFSSTSFIHHIKLVVTKEKQDLYGDSLANMEDIDDTNSAVIYLRPNSYHPEYFPRGTAFKIPKGYFMYLSQHLVTSGRKEDLVTKIKLQLGDPKKLSEIKHLFIIERNFTIPPGAREFTLTKDKKIEHDIDLVRVTLHMHKRGQKITLSTLAEDGTETKIFSIPKFSFNSNKSYFVNPFLRVKAGTTLRLTGVYDNSDANPNGVDFKASVPAGPDPETQEMLFSNMDYQDVKKISPKKP